MNYHFSRIVQGRQLCGEIGCRWQGAGEPICGLKSRGAADKKIEKQEELRGGSVARVYTGISSQVKLTVMLIAKIFNPHSP